MTQRGRIIWRGVNGDVCSQAYVVEAEEPRLFGPVSRRSPEPCERPRTDAKAAQAVAKAAKAAEARTAVGGRGKRAMMPAWFRDRQETCKACDNDACMMKHLSICERNTRLKRPGLVCRDQRFPLILDSDQSPPITKPAQNPAD